MAKAKLTIPALLDVKKSKTKLSMLSVTDATSARLAERAGIDIVCLGDSLGMVALGYPTTVPTTMEDMIRHGQAVRRGAPDTFLLACLPYQSYRTVELALTNATRYMQEVGADVVKVQGGARSAEIINALYRAGIPCMSHVGLVPHTVALAGGFKVQGRTAIDAYGIYEDALAVQQAGAIGVEIEAVPPEVASAITEKLDIFTYGIGAGPGCDGQILIGYDMLGFFDEFKPKFVKRYANLAEISVKAIAEFASDVQKEAFPAKEHCYSMPDQELEEFLRMITK